MNSQSIHAMNQESFPECRSRFLGQGVVLLLWFANIYDMGGGFGIKYASFALAMLYLFLHFKPFPMDSQTSHLFMFLFLLWPVLSLLHSVIAGAELSLAISQMTAFPAAIVFFLVIQSVRPRYALSVFLYTMLSLAVIVIALYLLMWFTSPFADMFMRIFSSEAHGYIGYRPFGNIFMPNVYLKATLFLVPVYVYFLFMAKPIHALIALLALVVAFSKAGFALCLLFTLYFLFLHRGDRRYKAAVIVLFIAVTPLVLGFEQFTEELLRSLTGEAETAQVRIGYLDSLLAMFGEDPASLLIGQGPGAVFYARNLGAFVSNIELDHLNAIRKFGLPWFMAFTAFVLAVSYRLFRSQPAEERALGLALLSLFIAAGTNPVLLSPAFLMFMAMATDFYWRRDETAR
ncbi:hypothetical protein Gmet_2175 [Geobacter metallireducens GS-15]|uniref:Uncharacterized protein n=2 Tax=Geobacter metallireducens TaxID=28232 RepID=Q39TM0_GEOMG|nr:hypothetical protein Gmet_2175 [Geobacter metallireducens GS-15]